MKKTFKYIIAAVALLSSATSALADDVDYEVGATVNTGSEEFAPYYIASNRGGTLTQQHSALLHGALYHSLDTTRRLSWGAGVEAWTGWSSTVDYRSTSGDLVLSNHPPRFWVQQLYVTGKYRGVFLTLGQQERGTPWLNQRLSSGDLVRSGNARPGYGASAGFINFQNIPFTHGWVQIRGELGYFRQGDGKWLEQHLIPENTFINTGYWVNYKNIYFRTKPTERLVFTIGMQAACQFGGDFVRYDKHQQVVEQLKMKADAEAFFKALLPRSGGSNPADKDYYAGNHLGSWDVSLAYRLPCDAVIKAYYQSPFEDGSGIGKKNGFDGLWGLEYDAGKPQLVSGAVVEYLDLTNQSGPLHFNPHDYRDDDRPGGSPITGEATGADDYYNNYAYNGYQNRGMSIGTPMVKSPLYHTDGYMRFFDNRMRGVHVALTGTLAAGLTYRAMYSWRKSWGNIFMPRLEPATYSSAMLEAVYDLPAVKGLKLSLQLGLDHGTLYNNDSRDKARTNFGAMLDITYHGNFSLR